MGVLLLIIVPIIYSFQTLFCKLFSDRYSGRKDLTTPVFCAVQGFFVCLFTWVSNGFAFAPSWGTVMIAVLNAIMILGYNSSLIKASAHGSYAFINVSIVFGGILLPIFYSVIFLNESLSPIQIVGVVFMLAASVVMNLKGFQIKGTSAIYYLFCLLLFIFNGVYSIMLKVQDVYRADQSNQMIMMTFVFMGIVALLQLVKKEKKNTFKAFKMDRRSALALILCLISATAGINLMVIALRQISATVMYTVNNGGTLVLAWVYSIILFKEKITLTSVISILMAAGSIVMLSI